MTTEKVLEEIREERARQEAKGYTAMHDLEHTTFDFVRYIRNYAGWAEQMADMGSIAKARRRLVQVAAIAVAAVDAIDNLEALRRMNDRDG